MDIFAKNPPIGEPKKTSDGPPRFRRAAGRCRRFPCKQTNPRLL